MSICAARKHDSGVFLINGAAGKRLGRLPLRVWQRKFLGHRAAPSAAAFLSATSKRAVSSNARSKSLSVKGQPYEKERTLGERSANAVCGMILGKR
jgi:hypothetical protein